MKPAEPLTEGTEMQERTVEQRIEDAFPFEVIKKPLVGIDGEPTNFHGLFRSDDGSCVSRTVVRGNYVPHTLDDIKAIASAAGQALEGGIADIQCTFNSGHYVIAQPSREHRLSVFGSNDNIFPRLVIRAGYGGQAFKATLGTYRDACRNLAMLRQVEGASRSIIHVRGLRDRMNDLVETFSIVAASWDRIGDVVRRMEANEVRLKDFLGEIYPEPERATGRAATEHEKRTEAIFRRILRERVATGRPEIGNEFIVTGWEAYNAVQGYMQHDSSRRGNPDDIRRAIMAHNHRAVRQAEVLALTMSA